MKTKLIAAALIAASAAFAAPAFASGMGPAPYYNPSVGAPASQRGVSAQTVAAEEHQANDNAVAYGGVHEGTSQAGSQAANPTSGRGSVFFGH
ncbi:MAG TPA: hypothetical protein VGL08_10325 [Paraburkholderia sp.]|jgi:hypothetical protein